MINPVLLCGVAFLFTVVWGKRVVTLLLEHGIGKRIRMDGPDSHRTKSGTATMGGLYILAAIGLIAVVLTLSGAPEALSPFVAMLGFGLLGAFDDLQGLKDIEGVGWLARNKFPWQWGMAILLSVLIFWATDSHPMIIPISGRVLDMGVWFIPVSTLLIVATSNAVNLTDGLDGLAGGTLTIDFLAYGVLAMLADERGVGYFCFALCGVLLAFLWFNVHPARLFMGDTGSQALGAGLAVVAMLSGHWLLLPIIGVIYAGEALSVILQVSYFKFTRIRYGEGRRIFRMAPLHHHYELGGWPEVQVTLRFWIVAAVAASVGVGLGVIR